MALLDAFRTITFLALLTTRFLHLAIGEEAFSIIRKSRGRGIWTNLDYFKPSSLECSGSGYPDCSAYNGHGVLRDCQCKCTYQVATFGFFSGSWTCLDNTEVRNRTGCKYKFEFENKDNYPLKIVKQDKMYNVILPSRGCFLESKTTRYFTCDGRWAEVDSQSWLTISHETKLRLSTSYRYQLMIGSDGVNDDLLGRIISLNITCANQDRSCLLFKLEGTIQCAENVTSATTIEPSPTDKASDKIPTIKATATATSTATATATVKVTPTNATANPNHSVNKKKAESGGSSWTVIGVVVTLVIIVVIVIVIIAYVYRKRKRGESVWLADHIFSRVRKPRSSQPKKKTVDETQQEPEYAEIPGEQRRNEPVDQAGGIYSYAFDDPQTAYIAPQPAPYNRLVHNRQGPDEEGAIYSTADDGPVYNVLERPPGEDHIAMAPVSTMNEGHPSHDLEPEYHVLERPYPGVK